MSRESPVVGILGTGDMGSAVARCLIDKGIPVITCLDGRSERSRHRAQAAGMTDTDSLDDMLQRTDILLSIIPPAAANDFALRVCPLLAKSGRDPLFVECNAVAPQTVAEIASIADDSKIRFQDVGIIGAAPQPGRAAVRFYTSGPYVAEVRQLATELVDIRTVGEEIGDASAIKMVYASMTKATHAVRAAAAIAGEKLGVGEAIRAEWRESLPDVYAAMKNRLPGLPGVSGRWVGEMQEIAKTYESIGLTPSFHDGAAWMYEMLSSVDPDIDAGIEQAIERFVEALEERSPT